MKKKKKRKYVRVAGYENRKPYGHRKGGMVALILKAKAGDILTEPLDKWHIPSLRTAAGALNTQVGYTRYSIATNKTMNVVYIINNDEP
jgi:hypothetical protein